MKHLIDSFPEAAARTARSMTYDLRKLASEHGWDQDVVNSMRILYSDSGFKVHVPKQYASRAHILEYGDETNAPTAVIRKFNNRSHLATDHFVNHLFSVSKGKL